MIGSSPARSMMKYRATFERQFAIAEQQKDAFGQPNGDWRPLCTVPCHAWFGASGGKQTSADGIRTVTSNMPGMIVPLRTDVTNLDRVQQVTDRAGSLIMGPMRIDAVDPRVTHLELRLLLVE